MKKFEKATLELTRAEYERLLKTGYAEISDPERGEMQVRMLFDEEHPGIKHKRLQVKIVKPGIALRRKT